MRDLKNRNNFFFDIVTTNFDDLNSNLMPNRRKNDVERIGKKKNEFCCVVKTHVIKKCIPRIDTSIIA